MIYEWVCKEFTLRIHLPDAVRENSIFHAKFELEVANQLTLCKATTHWLAGSLIDFQEFIDYLEVNLSETKARGTLRDSDTNYPFSFRSSPLWVEVYDGIQTELGVEIQITLLLNVGQNVDWITETYSGKSSFVGGRFTVTEAELNEFIATFPVVLKSI